MYTNRMSEKTELPIPFSISTHSWLKINYHTRTKLAILFSIPKSAGTDVLDGKVVCDGYTGEDLSTLTVERMKLYLGEDGTDDGYALLTRIITQIERSEILEEVATEKEQHGKSNTTTEAKE